MTKDKELVEVWRAEFESWYDAHTRFNYGVSYHFGANGKYCFDDIELAWQSFLAAKRSQPSVVLPKDYGNGKVEAKAVHAALTAAGIKYTIGE